MADYDYDLFVIGGGSGGVRAARLAAELGRRVAIAEADRFGGTCVIRGCVPKKLLVYASHFSEAFADAPYFGWTAGPPDFDWPTLIANKDREIARLERAYESRLTSVGVTLFRGHASFLDAHTIRVADPLTGEAQSVTADRVVVATGGAPNRLESLEGHELCITSDEAFHLERLPRSIIIKGGGYIAVEFAGIFAGLGVDTTLVYRGDHLLRGFDHDLGLSLAEAMAERGITVIFNTNIARVEATPDGRCATLGSGERLVADTVMLAVGRIPRTTGLGLDRAGVAVNRMGAVTVDAFSRTNRPHVLAVGDVTNRVALTPVAIHEAVCVVETEFRNNPTRPDHALIPTAIFSQPEIGTVGLGEAAASRRHDRLDVYKASFRPLKYSLTERNEMMMMKVIVEPDSGLVVGVHVIGPEAGEMAQLLGIALKMGATKADFDRTMAVHPTAGEELVTLPATPSYRVVRGVRVT